MEILEKENQFPQIKVFGGYCSNCVSNPHGLEEMLPLLDFFGGKVGMGNVACLDIKNSKSFEKILPLGFAPTWRGRCFRASFLSSFGWNIFRWR